MANLYQWTLEGTNEALRLFRRTVELDPDFGPAYGMAALCYVWRKVNGWMTDQAQESAEAGRLARRALDLGQDDAVALTFGGYYPGSLRRRPRGGAPLV